MTSEEREKAEAALNEFLAPNPMRIATENRAEMFRQGYAAGRESMQAALSEWQIIWEKREQAERERSRRLIERLIETNNCILDDGDRLSITRRLNEKLLEGFAEATRDK